MQNENNVLEIRDVSFAYSNVKVLNKVSFYGKLGELLVIAGPNGSGKTTLIKLVFDLLVRQEGDIRVAGEDNRNIHVKNKILYLPSDNVLPQFLTGREYVRLLCKMYDVELDIKCYEQIVEYYEMGKHMDDMIENYSHGMIKKVQLISAFLIQADITIVDETLNGIDIKAKEVSKLLLKKLAKKNKLVVMCTHDLELAEQIGTRAILMYNGDLCEVIDLIHGEGNASLSEIFKQMIGFKESNYEI